MNGAPGGRVLRGRRELNVGENSRGCAEEVRLR